MTLLELMQFLICIMGNMSVAVRILEGLSGIIRFLEVIATAVVVILNTTMKLC